MIFFTILSSAAEKTGLAKNTKWFAENQIALIFKKTKRTPNIYLKLWAQHINSFQII